MAYGALLAYATIAALLLVVGLSTASRPRLTIHVVIAAFLWPLTMAAITVRAAMLDPSEDFWAGLNARDTDVITRRKRLRAVALSRPTVHHVPESQVL